MTPMDGSQYDDFAFFSDGFPSAKGREGKDGKKMERNTDFRLCDFSRFQDEESRFISIARCLNEGRKIEILR